MSCKSTPDIFSLEMNDFPYCSAACTTASDPITVVISASATIIIGQIKQLLLLGFSYTSRVLLFFLNKFLLPVTSSGALKNG